MSIVISEMPEAHRHFLISFERGAPKWELLNLPGAFDLPAVKWRQHNLDLLSAENCATLVEKLEAILFPAAVVNESSA